MKEDRRGEFYSQGYCTATERDCDSSLKGACGVCPIGGTYRNTLATLSQETGLVKVCDETH